MDRSEKQWEGRSTLLMPKKFYKEEKFVLNNMEPTFPRCPLINTARLKPIRQRVNRIIMTITDSGHVSLEILGYLNNQLDGPEVAKELYHFSPDGKQIEVYQNVEGVAAIDGCPISSQPERVFLYPQLPEKLWRMYQHAYKFVDVIKSKTAKVVLQTDRAKCMLMENLPIQDFQVMFNDGVLLLLRESKLAITEADGSSCSYDINSISNSLSAYNLEKVDFTKKCHLQCLDIQESVSRLQIKEPKQELFPLSIGTKAAPFKFTTEHSSSTKKLTNEILENAHPPNSQTILKHCAVNVQPKESSQLLSKKALANQCFPPHEKGTDLARNNVAVSDLAPFEKLSLKQFQNCDSTSSAKTVRELVESKQFTCQHSGVPEKYLLTSLNCSMNSRNFPTEGKMSQSANTCEHCLITSEKKLQYDEINVIQANNDSTVPSHTIASNNVDSQKIYISELSSHNSEVSRINQCLGSHFQSNSYFTPKKSSASPVYHPQCYSVDSARHRQHIRTAGKFSLALGALVDENELKLARKTLFYENESVESLIVPSPLPDCHRHVLPDVPRNPSLELSFCESPYSDASVSNTEILFYKHPLDDKIVHSLDHHAEMTDELSNHSLKISTLLAGPPLKQPNTQDCSEILSFISCDSAIEVSFPLADLLDCTTRLPSSDPSATKTASCQPGIRPTEGSSPTSIPADSVAGNTLKEHNSQNSYTSSSSNSSSRNTSWCHSKPGMKYDHKLNKSDSGCYSMMNKGHYFPISPQKQFLMSEIERCKVDLSRPTHLHNSLDMSVSSYYSDSPSSSPSSGCDPIRQVFVPYTGWASFYATGAVWILYNDGTQLGIKSAEATMTYIDQDGSQKRYKKSDVIPEIIKIKLEKLPMVINMLMKSPPISSNLD